jgi:hypothetical protein
MNELLWYPQFAFMLKYFLSIPNLLEFIGEKSKSPQATQNLTAQIDFLTEKWDHILIKCKSINFGETPISIFEKPQSKVHRDGMVG